MMDEECVEFCCRCLEEFPVAEEPARWRMGQLRPLAKADPEIARGLGRNMENPYLCGNCWFDLTD